MVMDAATLQRAQEWSQKDPNETTAAHVQTLIQLSLSQSAAVAGVASTTTDAAAAAAASKELKALFPANNQRISFGTAGLRSAMKPGPLNMNDLVVLQTAQGLAKYCLATFSKDKKPSVCIGYDHRANTEMGLSSLGFAVLTASVFMQAGFDCLLLDGLVATPLVPFCLSQMNDASTETVGIMITASHNPKQDAGYKVYWSDGCQIRPPLDTGIADAIQDNLEPWIDYRQQLNDLRSNNNNKATNDPCLGLSRPTETKNMIAAYFQAIQASGLVTGQAKLLANDAATAATWTQTAPSFCYTAMHGVGHPFCQESFRTFGFPPFHSVPAQQQADPNFPTVSFPNPEEQGALDLAKAFSEEHGHDVILANDPDADRLAVAEKSRVDGTWTVFTGDEIGTMLGHWLWQQMSQQQQQTQQQPSTPKTFAMCASTVSSKMLAEIGRVEGFYVEDTLTGFKWIGSRAAELNRSGDYRSIFCYEEAIGFCCGDVIFDKDGISAMAVFADMTVNVYHRGLCLQEHMQSLYDKYGEFVSRNGYFFLNDMSVVAEIMDKITGQGKFDCLDTIGPYKVESFRYLGEPGYDSSTTDKKPTLPTSKSSPMMTIRFENGCVAQFRASGTEPKFKYYIEFKGKPGVSRSQVTQDLQVMSDYLLETLLEPDVHGLVRP
jgi:phosphoglucomutase/phosphoglucomutase/phosphopentomutase